MKFDRETVNKSNTSKEYHKESQRRLLIRVLKPSYLVLGQFLINTDTVIFIKIKFAFFLNF